MNLRSISISFNEPKTGKQLTRVYKLGLNESYSEGILSIVRALNFFYEQQVKFRINEAEDYHRAVSGSSGPGKKARG